MKRLLKAYACKDRRLAQQQLSEWYLHEPGNSLADIEQQLIDGVLANLFGYHLLQIGNVIPRNLLSASRIRHRMVMVEEWDDPNYRGTDEVGVIIGQSQLLALDSDSIDVVLCPHVLEFSAMPHEVLREIERVLIPEGHLVLLGFNPWSSWGIIRAAFGWRQSVPWCGRFISGGRLRDWLALLGFDTVVYRTGFFRPPLHHAGLLHRLDFIERLGSRWWPPLGGVQLLVAKKRVATLTPIKPRWRPRRSLLQGKLPEATLRRDK